MAAILANLIVVLVFALLIWVYWKKAISKIIVPPVIAQEGISIPVISAYQGTRLFNVHNGLWPGLTLFEDHFEFRIFNAKSFSFGDVKSVDAISGFWSGGTSVLISFNDGAWNYRAFMNKHNLREVLTYFKAKGCMLTPKAEEFLNQPA